MATPATSCKANGRQRSDSYHQSQDEEAEESTVVRENLAHFRNVKNEFVIWGELATYELLHEGYFEESIKVCKQVLAVDPNNEDMSRLKEKLQTGLLNKESIKEYTDSPVRKLRRSVSEIKSKRSFLENGSSSNEAMAVDVYKSSDAKPMRHTIINGSDTHAAALHEQNGDSPNSMKIKRSQSMGIRKRSSVLQKIQQFEQAAEKKNSQPPPLRLERRPSRKQFQQTVKEGEIYQSGPDSGFNSSHSFENSDSIEPVKIKEEPVSPAAVPTLEPLSILSNGKSTRRHQQLQRAVVFDFSEQAKNPVEQPATIATSNTGPKSSEKIDETVIVLHKSSKSPTIEPEAPKHCLAKSTVTRQLSQDSANKDSPSSASKVQIARQATSDCPAEWTDHGVEMFSEAVLKQLGLEFFKSKLITRGCLLSPEGNILGLTVGFRIKQYEIQTLLNGMADAKFITSSKLIIGGIQFSCLSGTHTVVRGRIQKWGINCTKFKPLVSANDSRASSSSNPRLSNSNFKNEGGLVIVAMYEHPVLPKEIAMLIRRVGTILEESNSPDLV